jgi:hypothetical protein
MIAVEKFCTIASAASGSTDSTLYKYGRDSSQLLVDEGHHDLIVHVVKRFMLMPMLPQSKTLRILMLMGTFVAVFNFLLLPWVKGSPVLVSLPNTNGGLDDDDEGDEGGQKCRYSMGKRFVVDDHGRVCEWERVGSWLPNGCCNMTRVKGPCGGGECKKGANYRMCCLSFEGCGA